MSIPFQVSRVISERRARALVKARELRGWLQKDPARQIARTIPSKFQDLMSSSQDRQSGSN